MKYFLILSVLSLTLSAQAAEWKTIAETVSCSEKVEILAKEGEKYVIASYKDNKKKLFAPKGETYNPESLTGTSFTSDASKEKYLLGEPTFTYTQPGYVEGNPPKIDVFYSGRKEHCAMNLK